MSVDPIRWLVVLSLLVLIRVQPVAGFAYLGDKVVHVPNYTGAGGVLDLTVGILPASPYALEMEIPIRNTLFTINELEAVESNIDWFGVPDDQLVDFETVLIHEMCHALGLGHVNLGNVGGLAAPEREYVSSTVGANGVFDLDPGPDGVIGSADDVRGDDLNRHFFKIVDNDPFRLPSTDVVDSSTYSKDLSVLPAGDQYSAKAGRHVGPLPRYNSPNAESVMNQQSYYDEIQRYLVADDIAGLRYAMSGMDELQGTADDYIINLIYAGLTDTADIRVSFNDSITTFAQTSVTMQAVGPGHQRMVNPRISFNSGWNWYFNEQLVPEPGSLFLFCLGMSIVISGRIVNVRKYQ